MAGTSKSMPSVKHVTSQILMTVDYCKHQLAQRLGRIYSGLRVRNIGMCIKYDLFVKVIVGIDCH